MRRLLLKAVKRRLRAHIQFWIDIGAPEWVLSVIKHGYFIPFETTTPSIRLGNNRSAKNHPGFVFEAVSYLLELGFITEMLGRSCFTRGFSRIRAVFSGLFLHSDKAK